MKLLKGVFLFVIPIMLQSCSGGSGGCEMMYSNAEFIGSLYLTKESENWVPEKGLDSVLFANNKGAKFFFKITKYLNTNNKFDLYLNQNMKNETCTTKDYNYVMGYFEDYRLKNENVPFSINITRWYNFNERKVSDTIKLSDLINLSDRVDNYIAYSTASFALIDSLKYPKSDRIFLDSLYKEVYELPCKVDLSYGAPIKSMFLQRGKGLIGFEFINNELWVRKAF